MLTNIQFKAACKVITVDFCNFHSYFKKRYTLFYKQEFELDRAFYKPECPLVIFTEPCKVLNHVTSTKQIHVVPIQTRATRKWLAIYAFIVCQFKFSHVHFCFMQHLMSDLGWPQTQNTRVQNLIWIQNPILGNSVLEYSSRLQPLQLTTKDYVIIEAVNTFSHKLRIPVTVVSFSKNGLIDWFISV